MEEFGKAVLKLMFGIFVMVINAFVLIKLWGWFVYPVFGISLTSKPLALGLMLIISWTTQYDASIDIKKEYRNEDTLEKGCVLFVRPLMALLVGWIVTQFI